MRVPLLLRAFALGLCLGPAGLSAQSDQVVEAIEIRAGRALEPEAISPWIEVEVGQPLSASAVRRTLDNLATIHESAEVSIWQSPGANGGVVLTVALEPQLLVRTVGLSGHLGLRREALLGAIEQGAGAPLVEGRLVRSVFALQDLLDEHGYLARDVQLSVEVDSEDRKADVTFRVDSGPRSVIAGARFRGELKGLDPRELEAALQLSEGQKYSPRNEAAARRRAEEWLRRQGFLEARLEEPEFEYDLEGSSLVMVYGVRIGQPVRVEVQGADADELRRKDLLPFASDGAFDRSLMPRAAQRIRDDYQLRGFHDVAVSVDAAKGSEGELIARFTVEPGRSYVLRDVRVEGAPALSSDRARSLLETSRKRRFDSSSGALVDSTVERDVRNLTAFLIRQGFGQARVESQILKPAPGVLEIVFRVEQGARSRVSSMTFDGGGVLEASALEVEGQALVGGAYHPGLDAELTGRLLDRCERLGYRRPRISVDTVAVGDFVYDLSVRVDPGPQTVVDRIVVRGAGRTDRDLVLKALDFEGASSVSREDLLEAQRNLYRLGIFKRVRVSLAARSRRETGADGQRVDLRDVIVDLEEARRWRLGYGLGFDSEDGLGGLLSVTRSNLLQRGSTLRLDLNLSEREKRARLLFSDRPSRRVELPVRYAVYRLEETFSSFESVRFGGQVESTLPLTNRLRLGLFYDYRIVELEAEEELDLSTLAGGILDRELVDTEVSSLTATLLYDRRNDPLDPSRGWSSTLQLEGAFPFLDADERFFKLFGQFTGYIPMGRFGAIGTSVRYGAIEPTGDATPGPGLRQTVPISERFFAGGRTSHRAYRRDRLGVDGSSIVEGIEIGGEGLALVNVDYRFPIAGPVGGTVFVDSGNVWAVAGDVSLDDFKTGAGVGIRYRSPIGPLRLEVGWKLDRLPGESSPLVLVSFGNAF